jgi:translocation and assembly module TamA
LRGVFSSVIAVGAKQVDAEGRLPLTFVVRERKRHAVGLGAAYASDQGASFSTTWQDRNLLGNAEQLKLAIGFSAAGTARTGPGYWGSLQFLKPDFLQRDQTLRMELNPVKESVLAYDRTAFSAGVFLSRKLADHWTGSVGFTAERESVTQQNDTERFNLVGLPLNATYDSTNDLFNPTRGVRASLSLTPSRTIGNRAASFLMFQASGSTYLDAGDSLGAGAGRTLIALRGLVGAIEGASLSDVPADKRFYAGGSGTVRGYKYQSIGPSFPDNQPQGGTAVIAGSLELRQRILADYGAVAFVDAGQVAANGWSFASPWGVGAGVGARYFTPIGPVRVDVALPLNKLPESGNFELYIGIGQAF